MDNKLPLIVLMAFTLTACSKPEIDTSSDESLRRTTEEVRNSLPAEERADFENALTLVMMSSISLDSLATGSLDDIERGAEEAAQAARTRLDGMTAEEVLREAERIRQEQAQREREQALREIETLREHRQKAQQDAQALRSFVLSGVRFYKERDYFGYPEPRIRMTMTNNTEFPISRAYFKGVLQSPGRTIPWLEEDFNYKIEGGLEPGETKSVTLAPNQFSEWGTTDAPGDAVLEVQVMRLDGANEEELFNAEFSSSDEERLRELLLKYGQSAQSND